MSTAFSGVTPSRAELLEYLSASRIAGPVATSRENNLANFKLMAQRDPGYLFGLEPRGAWSFDDILALMASRCGVSPDPLHDSGADSIDPALTLERIEAMALHLGRAAATRARVLVATGHPTGVMVIHIQIARFLRAAGCTLLAPPAWWNEGGSDGHGAGRPRERHVRCVLDVSVASQGANLLHTHSPVPMELMLRALADEGQPPPDLVVADHGFAGAAGRAGVPCVGFADSNDPALFVGEAEGDVAVCVPLDDNVMPHLYEPLANYLLAAAATAAQG
jgi:histidinol phosphate phosphatase hisN-like protein